jgi:hypothetical protein
MDDRHLSNIRKTLKKKHPSTDQKHTSKNLQKHYESKADGSLVILVWSPMPLTLVGQVSNGFGSILKFFFQFVTSKELGSFS